MSIKLTEISPYANKDIDIYKQLHKLENPSSLKKVAIAALRVFQSKTFISMSLAALGAFTLTASIVAATQSFGIAAIILGVSTISLTALTALYITNPKAFNEIISGVKLKTIFKKATLKKIFLSLVSKDLKYETSLFSTIQKAKKDLKKNPKNLKHPWISEITNNIYLGGLPIKEIKVSDNSSKKTFAQYCKDKKINAVLSMVEDFEIETNTWFSTPISKKDWEDNGVTVQQIKASDFKPLTQKQLKDGVKFLEEQIDQGKKVYVHCKAGRGRSVAVVASYLIKHEYKDIIDSIQNSKGPLIQEEKLKILPDPKPIDDNPIDSDKANKAKLLAEYARDEITKKRPNIKLNPYQIEQVITYVYNDLL